MLSPVNASPVNPFDYANSVGGVHGTQSLSTVASESYTPLSADYLLEYCALILGYTTNKVSGMIADAKLNVARKRALDKAAHAMSLYPERPQNNRESSATGKAIQEAYESLPGGDPIRKQLEELKGRIAPFKLGPTERATVQTELSAATQSKTEIQAILDHMGDEKKSKAAFAKYRAMHPEDAKLTNFKIQEKVEGKLDEQAALIYNSNLRFELCGDNTLDTSAWKAAKDELESTSRSLSDMDSLKMQQIQSLISEQQTTVQLTTNILAKLSQITESIVQKI